MNKKWRRLFAITSLIIGLIVFPLKGAAKEETTLVNEAGYVYDIQFPENQIENSGALKLMLTAGQNQRIPVKIRNLGKEELTLELSLNGARTNGAGGLEYGPTSFKKDKSMKYDLPDLVSIPEEMTVPGNSEAFFDVEIKMPDVAYDGLVIGGVEMQAKQKAEKTDNSTTIVNKIAYLFGVNLQMTETVLEPDLALEKVYPELENYRNAIFLDISNLQALKLEGLTIDTEIMKQGSQDVLYSSKKSNMQMAPNTLMSYPVSLSGEKMIAGKYTASVTANAKGKEWSWQEDFTITNEQADQFNQEDVNLVQERGLDWSLIALIVGGSLAVVLVGYLIMRVLKKKKLEPKSKRPSTRKTKK